MLIHGGIMSVYDARVRIQKKKKTVSDVEKAEAILKAHKEKQKKGMDENLTGGGQGGQDPAKKTQG